MPVEDDVDHDVDMDSNADTSSSVHASPTANARLDQSNQAAQNSPDPVEPSCGDGTVETLPMHTNPRYEKHFKLHVRKVVSQSEQRSSQSGLTQDEDLRQLASSSVDSIFSSSWTEQHKNAFFASVARHSRLRPDLIAAELSGSTGFPWSGSLVAHHISLLSRAAEQSSTSASRLIRALPQAYESSEDWIAAEEREAQSLQRMQKHEVSSHKPTGISWDEQVGNLVLFLRHHSDEKNPSPPDCHLLLSCRPINVWTLESLLSRCVTRTTQTKRKRKGTPRAAYLAFAEVHPVPLSRATSSDEVVKDSEVQESDQDIVHRALSRAIDLGFLLRVTRENVATSSTASDSPCYRLSASSPRAGRSIGITSSLNSTELIWADESEEQSTAQLLSQKLESTRQAAMLRLLASTTTDELRWLHSALADDEEEASNPDLYRGVSLARLTGEEKQRAKARIRMRQLKYGDAGTAMPLEPIPDALRRRGGGRGKAKAVTLPELPNVDRSSVIPLLGDIADPANEASKTNQQDRGATEGDTVDKGNKTSQRWDHRSMRFKAIGADRPQVLALLKQHAQCPLLTKGLISFRVMATYLKNSSSYTRLYQADMPLTSTTTEEAQVNLVETLPYLLSKLERFVRNVIQVAAVGERPQDAGNDHQQQSEPLELTSVHVQRVLRSWDMPLNVTGLQAREQMLGLEDLPTQDQLAANKNFVQDPPVDYGNSSDICNDEQRTEDFLHDEDPFDEDEVFENSTQTAEIHFLRKGQYEALDGKPGSLDAPLSSQWPIIPSFKRKRKRSSSEQDANKPFDDDIIVSDEELAPVDSDERETQDGLELSGQAVEDESDDDDSGVSSNEGSMDWWDRLDEHDCEKAKQREEDEWDDWFGPTLPPIETQENLSRRMAS